jgi:hypothetical protein
MKRHAFDDLTSTLTATRAPTRQAARRQAAEIRALTELVETVRRERDEALRCFAHERAERAAAERRLYEEGRQVAALAAELRRLEGQLAERERRVADDATRPIDGGDA